MSEARNDFQIEDVDEVIHGRVRLGAMAYLAGAGEADFTTLKGKLGVTDGNLSVHLKKLEDAGYVAVTKRFAGKKPQTTLAITDDGKAAFLRYLDAMSKLVAGR